MQSKPKAYSYIRISSAGQIAGDGLRRQLERAKAYAAEYGLELDDKLKDVGSGYHGKHVKFGALGGFLDLVRSGKVPKGSYLIVESLDRLSREAVIDAQLQLLNLLKAGIVVVTLIDGAVYSEDKDFTQLIISLTIMSRAHEESATKSYRAKERIRKRKADALAGKKVFMKNLAGWIDQIPDGDEYKFELNSHVPTVRRVFELADKGVGTHSIARIFNKEGLPVLRKGVNPYERWRDNAVARILKDETTIGTLTVFEEVDGKRVPMGEPIKNYYPAAVSEELFWRVQRNRPAVPHKGRRGDRYANLFPRITACAGCGHVLKMYYGGRTHNRKSYFGCSQRHIAGNTCNTEIKLFPYDTLERAILDHISEFRLDEQLASDTNAVSRTQLVERIEATEATVANLEKRRENLLNTIEQTDDREDQRLLLDRLAGFRVQLEQSKAELADLRKRLAEQDEQRRAIISVKEKIALERLKWTTGTETEIFTSRASVSQSLRKFITLVTVDFYNQAAIVEIAGGAKGYVFDRDGNLIDHLDMTDMPFEEFEGNMKKDGKSLTDIAQAKSSYELIKAAEG